VKLCVAGAMRSLMRQTAISLVFAVVTAGLVCAQSMQDGSWVYDDGWSDSSYVWGYGQTGSSWLADHSFAVDITITSPLGNSTSVSAGFDQWGTSTSTFLEWSYGDFGDYLISINHRTFCSIVMAAFLAAATVIIVEPPGEPCSGPDSWTCTERNDELPLGTMKGAPRCRQYTACCTPNNPPMNGWCRVETCNKCAGQSVEPVNAICVQNERTCKDAVNSFLCGPGCQ
jgi:hypothetical protein